MHELRLAYSPSWLLLGCSKSWDLRVIQQPQGDRATEFRAVRTDSLAFDLHKWGYLPYEVGCVLVRDAAAHRATFATSANYLEPPGRGIQPTALDFPELGLQLSRGFRALKVWMSLKTHGHRRLGQLIDQNVAQAQHLVQRIATTEQLEQLGPAPLNVVCFRYLASGLDDAALDELNREILLRVQETGVAIPSSTRRDDPRRLIRQPPTSVLGSGLRIETHHLEPYILAINCSSSPQARMISPGATWE